MSTAAKFKLAPPVIAEDDLHQAVARALDLLLLPPAEWTTVAMGGYALTPAAAARLVRLGASRGWPDILLVWNGSAYGIELKTSTGRLSKTRLVRSRTGHMRLVIGQDERHERLAAAGMRLAVCRSVDDVLAQLAAWGLPLRGVR